MNILTSSLIETPLGKMIAIADNASLYLLEFTERRALTRNIERLCQKTQADIIQGLTEPIALIKKELKEYFAGNSYTFTTQPRTLGTAFQTQVWKALQNIPVGKTCSYLELANAVDNPAACRAVAQANACNQTAIIIPCHRVINSNGDLGGYAGGIHRKQWLLDHEINAQS